MYVLKPPAPLELPEGKPTIVLAGSVEIGEASDWRSVITTELGALDVLVLDPRRDAWEATLRQRIDEPTFREQVEWELTALDRADVIAMWFAPETAAPITLLELGLHVRDRKLVVGCPDGYWRKGNVEVVCARFGVEVHAAWTAFVAAVAGAATARAPSRAR